MATSFYSLNIGCRLSTDAEKTTEKQSKESLLITWYTHVTPNFPTLGLYNRDVNKAGSFKAKAKAKRLKAKAKSLKAKARSLKAKTKAKARDQG